MREQYYPQVIPPYPVWKKYNSLDAKKMNYDMSSIGDFIKFMHTRCMTDFKGIVLKKKCPDSDFSIPVVSDFGCLSLPNIEGSVEGNGKSL